MSKVVPLDLQKTLLCKCVWYKDLGFAARPVGPNPLSRRWLELKAHAFPDVVTIADTPRCIVWRRVAKRIGGVVGRGCAVVNRLQRRRAYAFPVSECGVIIHLTA